MSELTKVRKVMHLPNHAHKESEIPDSCIEEASHWFAQFCDKEPSFESIDYVFDGTICRASFVVFLSDEELKKYYDFEKLIDEGKI